MDLAFTPEQDQLRDNLRRFLAANFPFADRRAASASGGRSPGVWRALASELGVLGVGLPETLGGAGGSAVEQMIVAEELGRALCLEPYAETVAMAAPVLLEQGGEVATGLLRRIAAGEAIVACALFEPTTRHCLDRIETRAVRTSAGWALSGAKSAVAAFPAADWLLLAARTAGKAGDRAGLSLFLVSPQASGLENHPFPTIDGRRAADLYLRNVEVGEDALIGPLGEALPILDAMVDRGIAAGAAEAVGTMRRALAESLAYAQVRRQFGQTLADMQVIQHKLADMHVKLELASAASLLATLRLDASTPVRSDAASTARIVVSKAMRFVGQAAVQLHGGMGMVDELAVAHAFKRLTMIDAEFGSLDHHLRRKNALTAQVSG